MLLAAFIKIPDGLGVRIPDSHSGGPGSIPGQGASFLELIILNDPWAYHDWAYNWDLASNQKNLSTLVHDNKSKGKISQPSNPDSVERKHYTTKIFAPQANIQENGSLVLGELKQKRDLYVTKL